MKYIDLKIIGDDLAVDGDGLATFVWDRDSIAQDIKHMIRESGYLVAMIAERSTERRQIWVQKIIVMVEEDTRLIPGTVELTATTPATQTGKWVFTLAADTYEFGKATLKLTIEE